MLFVYLPLENIDYVPVQVELTFTAGSGPGTTMSVEVTILDDSEEEETEIFSGGLSVTASQSIVVSPGNVAVNIIDNDGDGKRCYVRYRAYMCIMTIQRSDND